MAGDLLGYVNLNEQMAIQDAASAGMKSMEQLIRAVSCHQHQQCLKQQIDCREITDFTVSNFKKVISILQRTGHARFRRAPIQVLAQSPESTSAQNQATASGSNKSHNQTTGIHQPQALNLFSESTTPVAAQTSAVEQQKTPDFRKSSVTVFGKDAREMTEKEAGLTLSTALSTSGNSSLTLLSSITGEGSVSNGRGEPSLTFLTPSISTGKPPLSGKRCREHGHSDNFYGKSAGSGRCHCKKRKLKMKKTVRVPAVSSKVADIPADDYSWRKYGQKPIKGSPYPRGYYRCSTVKDCPAKKHVERAKDDPTMLIITYEWEHRHAQAGSQFPPPPVNTATAAAQLVFDSARG